MLYKKALDFFVCQTFFVYYLTPLAEEFYTIHFCSTVGGHVTHLRHHQEKSPTDVVVCTVSKATPMKASRRQGQPLSSFKLY